MPVAPTRVGRYAPTTGNYASTTTPKTTDTFDMQVGDRFWTQAQVENAGSQTVITPSVSAGGITWTLQARVPVANDVNVSALWGWTGLCTAAATGCSITLDRPTTDGTLWWGFSATLVRGASGVGTIFNNNNGTGSGTPLDSRTVSANSLVLFNVNDWNAADGTSRTYRMGATESNYFRDAARHTVYGAYVANTSAGTFDAGLSAPSGMRWGLIGVEFLGIDTVGVPALQESGAGIYLEDGTQLLF